MVSTGPRPDNQSFTPRFDPQCLAIVGQRRWRPAHTLCAVRGNRFFMHTTFQSIPEYPADTRQHFGKRAQISLIAS
jgi:hypothetical protein